MERIYVLAKISADSLETTVSQLHKVKGVREVDTVTGSYDMVVCIEGENIARMLSSVVREVRNVPGIITTETLVVIDMD
jgi:DNA-binding Lrp family transcriptional regulator